MKHLVRYLLTIDRRWLLTWAAIYVGFATMGAFFPDFIGVTVLKIVGIALCLVYAMAKFKKDALLTIALALTLLADVILAIDSVSIIGVFTFCFVQFFHTARLKQTKPVALVFYVLIAAIVFLVAVWLKVNPMYAAAGIYAYGIFSNVFFAASWFFSRRSVQSACAAVGFLLFILCDFCVAGSYLSATAVLPLAVKPFMDYFAWIFYYPSQVLIANSSELAATSKKPRKKLAPSV
ncbi:hypothetical protein IKF40_02445 [Candidatus Saccharibacteria bacterium]|nr:hypothetical protein [Candidatus Saccharibacteria bacterium]